MDVLKNNYTLIRYEQRLRRSENVFTDACYRCLQNNNNNCLHISSDNINNSPL